MGAMDESEENDDDDSAYGFLKFQMFSNYSNCYFANVYFSKNLNEDYEEL